MSPTPHPYHTVLRLSVSVALLTAEVAKLKGLSRADINASVDALLENVKAGIPSEAHRALSEEVHQHVAEMLIGIA